MIPVSKTLETDIAVVGGGIGGLCAAIAAAEGGARVMVLEKANTKRSGSGATGNDHFACYYPKHHGGDIRPILRELLDSLVGLCHDPLLSLRFLERSISIVDKWHEWGINMKPFAEDYVFMGHAYPDRPRIWLKYDVKFLDASQFRRCLLYGNGIGKPGYRALQRVPSVFFCTKKDCCTWVLPSIAVLFIY